MSAASRTFVNGLIFLLQVFLTALDCWVLLVARVYEFVFKSGSATPQAARKTVVIVGGNFSGLAALWELVKHRDRFRIVLMDQKDYFEYTPGVLRLFCSPGHFASVAQSLPGDKDSRSGPFEKIQGKVTSIADEQGQKILSYVHKSRTTTLSYDYLVLATGSTYNYPVSASGNELSLEERKRGWEAAHRRLSAAAQILILGGGAVGVELAAEIVDFFPKKQVTLVDASPTLVPLFHKSVGEYAARWLNNHGVRLVLGQFLASWDESSCELKNGTVLHADIVYVCFGDRPNSQCATVSSRDLAESQSTSVMVPFNAKLDRRKCLIVADTLQLSTIDSQDCIFACGDVAAPPTEGNKQAFHAEIQGHLAGCNVVRLEQQRELLKYPDHIAGASQMPLIFILSLGRYDGVLGFNRLIINGPITAVLKWGLEFTKVMHMRGRPFGKIIWGVAEEVVLFLSRTFVKPAVQSSVIAKTKVG